MTPYQEALRQERDAKHLLDQAHKQHDALYDRLLRHQPIKHDSPHYNTELDRKRLIKSIDRLTTAHIKARDALTKAIALLPPPKPNEQVLESALQHTPHRDGLGWGFEHDALTKDAAYRKWLKKAAKRPTDLE